ncbi:MAG: hypothetical protein COT74_11965 [Bdellovibrionales bacterium CG10_big_fil_rev_8_21_14_0_10_45_34]|nr:MAG: hypothetical protein COT74_11965 [Bdellovibrionales bacterium CG10_big_fil_rev_8_21_14_0_10_45_34]
MKSAFAMLFVSTLIVGCQKDQNNNPVANVVEAAKDTDLQGKTFGSQCMAKPIDALLTGVMTLGKSSIKSQQVTYRFEGANVNRQTRLFGTSDCTGEAVFNFEESGTIKIDKDSVTTDGGQNIEMDFLALKAGAATVAGATAANAISLCGISDWTIDQMRDVRAQAGDLMCYGATVPRHVSNVYRVEAGLLYLGTQSKGAIPPEERPSSLDKTVPYHSQ